MKHLFQGILKMASHRMLFCKKRVAKIPPGKKMVIVMDWREAEKIKKELATCSDARAKKILEDVDSLDYQYYRIYGIASEAVATWYSRKLIESVRQANIAESKKIIKKLKLPLGTKVERLEVGDKTYDLFWVGNALAAIDDAKVYSQLRVSKFIDKHDCAQVNMLRGRLVCAKSLKGTAKLIEILDGLSVVSDDFERLLSVLFKKTFLKTVGYNNILRSTWIINNAIHKGTVRELSKSQREFNDNFKNILYKAKQIMIWKATAEAQRRKSVFGWRAHGRQVCLYFESTVAQFSFHADACDPALPAYSKAWQGRHLICP